MSYSSLLKSGSDSPSLCVCVCMHPYVFDEKEDVTLAQDKRQKANANGYAQL